MQNRYFFFFHFFKIRFADFDHVFWKEICDKTKCAGVLKYYEALGCTPVYKNPNDCCAESYNCTHLDNLSRDKCYVNGHEYSDGETLRPEDANPCDIGCKCLLFNDEWVHFRRRNQRESIVRLYSTVLRLTVISTLNRAVWNNIFDFFVR